MKDANIPAQNRKGIAIGVILATTAIAVAAFVFNYASQKPSAEQVANQAIKALKNQNADAYVSLASKEALKNAKLSEEQLKSAFEVLSSNLNITSASPSDCQTYDNQVTQCSYPASYKGVKIAITIDVAKVNNEYQTLKPVLTLISPQLIVNKLQARGQSKKQILIAMRSWAQDSKRVLSPIGIQNFESGSEIATFDHYIERMDAAIVKWEELEKK